MADEVEANAPEYTTRAASVANVPRAWAWNLTFERQLPWTTTVEVGYVGRRGLDNQRKRNINQLLPGTLQANPGVNVNALPASQRGSKYK